MKKKSLKKLLELLAGGLPLENAWEQAGFLSISEAQDALREMAAIIGGEDQGKVTEPVSAGTEAREANSAPVYSLTTSLNTWRAVSKFLSISRHTPSLYRA